MAVGAFHRGAQRRRRDTFGESGERGGDKTGDSRLQTRERTGVGGAQIVGASALAACLQKWIVLEMRTRDKWVKAVIMKMAQQVAVDGSQDKREQRLSRVKEVGRSRI